MHFLLSLLFIAIPLQSQNTAPLTVDFIATHIDQLEPESIRLFLKQHPETAVTIHQAAMARINYEDSIITRESTPEETATNGGATYTVSSAAAQIPVQYEPLLRIIEETFAHESVILTWLEALKSDDCLGAEIHFRRLIAAKAINEKESHLLKTIFASIENNGPVFEALLEPMNHDENSFLYQAYEWADFSVRKVLEEKTQNALQQRNLHHNIGFNEETYTLLTKSKYPMWAYAANKNEITQTEAHMLDNPKAQQLWIHTDETVRALFYEIHALEKQERSKGNYVFYHGQTWDYHLYADLYKHLWNIAKNDTVGDDFTFTRFNEQQDAIDKRTDCLWMNGALFGNAYNAFDCTAYYFYNNTSIIIKDDLIESLFSQLNMSDYYQKYKDEIDVLKDLHTQANENTQVGAKFVVNDEIKSYSGCGNLLLISIPAEEMHRVRIVSPGSGELREVPTTDGSSINDAKAAIDTLLTDTSRFAKPHHDFPSYMKGSDYLVYTLPLTTDYALDPHKGPRIHEFNAADQTKFKAYTVARDALFAKIKKEIESKQDHL